MCNDKVQVDVLFAIWLAVLFRMVSSFCSNFQKKKKQFSTEALALKPTYVATSLGISFNLQVKSEI